MVKSQHLHPNWSLMDFNLQLWQLYVVILTGWINRQQQEVIEYLLTENQVLKEKLGKKRILLTDDQRRRLAVKGKILGRKSLRELTTIVTPDTILRWHRQLLTTKSYYSNRRKSVGRPRIRQVIVDLMLRFARENHDWGYDRIQGALANVGYHISDTTVGNVLKQHGIEPAPISTRSVLQVRSALSMVSTKSTPGAIALASMKTRLGKRTWSRSSKRRAYPAVSSRR